TSHCAAVSYVPLTGRAAVFPSTALFRSLPRVKTGSGAAADEMATDPSLSMNPSAPSEITAQLSGACTVLERHLGETLLAIHLFGSAIDGGLRPHSDIDLLVTVSVPVPDPVRRSLMLDLLPVSAWPGSDPARRALEVTLLVREHLVPWRYPPPRELQFGEWLREDRKSTRL